MLVRLIVISLQLFFFILLFSCDNDSKADCQCPMGQVYENRVVETTDSLTSSYSVNISPKVSAVIKKVAELDILTSANASNHRAKITSVINGISIDLNSNVAARFEFEKLFFCTRHEMYCKSNAYSEEEKVVKLEYELNFIRRILDSVRENSRIQTEPLEVEQPIPLKPNNQNDPVRTIHPSGGPTRNTAVPKNLSTEIEFIEATGKAIISEQPGGSRGQKLIEAEQVAEAEALASLAAKIHGVRVSKKTTITNGKLELAKIELASQGLLRYVECRTNLFETGDTVTVQSTCRIPTEKIID